MIAIDLQAVQGFFDRAPFMVDLGVQAVAAGVGSVTTVLPIQPRHFQHTGQVHAGVMATMADHTMGAAAQTQAPAGHWVITAELKTSLLRPAQGERLVCEAVVIKAGLRLSFTEAEVYAESGAESGAESQGQRKLVMKASATMALVPQKE